MRPERRGESRLEKVVLGGLFLTLILLILSWSC